MRDNPMLDRVIGGLALLVLFWLVYGLVLLSKWAIAKF